MLAAKLISACPPALRKRLARYLFGEASGEITLMHFTLQLGDADALRPLIENLVDAAPERKELLALRRLVAMNADHLSQVAALGNAGLVEMPLRDSNGISAMRQQFDRAVAIAPEASVALYSLGSAEILDRATNEIVIHLAEWGLLRSDSAVLDIGCGIGRIERALAPQVGTITAIDISSGMIEEARQRCGNLPNVAFLQCDGRDLAGYQDRSYDLALAIDSFPYLFAVDLRIIDHHFRDCARTLRPGGALVILNFSYRGDGEADRRDVQRLANDYGFTVERPGTRDFTLWDGLTFLLTLPAHPE